jgi:predicted MPP superfamily phosphohydrolase
MRLLHISDLHIRESIGRNDEYILSRFCDFLTANALVIPFDHIVLTGDLRDGQDSVAVDDAVSIVNHITKSVNVVKKESIHVVPGNHDLKRGDGEDKNIIGEIRKAYDCKNGTFSDISLPLMVARFDEFFWPFCDKFYGESNPWQERNANPHALRFDKENAFVYLNSCLTCIENNMDGNLVVGLAYLDKLIKIASDAKNIFIMSHHPIQNFATGEEAELQRLVESYPDKIFYWLCGDAHRNRAGSRDYIHLYQVGSLTGMTSTIPDFAIYDITDGKMERRVFRFLPHLNSPSPNQGGWKRVYIDPKSPSLNFDIDMRS